MAAGFNTAAVPKLGDIISALKEITDPHELGIHLGIEAYELEKFEKNYPRDVERQKLEAIKHWQRNFKSSWEALADAVEKMGNHRNLAEQLRDMHLEAVKNVETRVVDKTQKQGS